MSELFTSSLSPILSLNENPLLPARSADPAGVLETVLTESLELTPNEKPPVDAGFSEVVPKENPPAASSFLVSSLSSVEDPNLNPPDAALVSVDDSEDVVPNLNPPEASFLSVEAVVPNTNPLVLAPLVVLSAVVVDPN